jgi:imidazolonepropionase-like amidohydrolase
MAGRKHFIGAQIIPLSDKMTIIPEGYITVAEGRIQALGSGEEFQAEEADTIVDLQGMTVLPGLIDSHCHLISENQWPITEQYITKSCIDGVRVAQKAVEHGITAVRDVGCRHLGIYSLKNALEAGQIPGPKLKIAGRPMAGTGIMKTWRSHAHDGPVAIRKAVRTEWEAGADWIKLSVSDGRWRSTQDWQDTPLLTEEEIASAVQEAHAKDLKVACHVDGPVGAALAVRNGVDSIEHGVHIPDELLEQMVEKEIVFVPTVWIYRTQDLDVFKADLSFLNDLHRDTIRRAKEKGVRIAAGVDYSYLVHPPLDGVVQELRALMDSGLTAREALLAATRRGAELLGWEQDIGSLSEGKVADFIVLEDNPLEDIRNLNRLRAVIQNGNIVKEMGLVVS